MLGLFREAVRKVRARLVAPLGVQDHLAIPTGQGPVATVAGLAELSALP